MIVVLLLLKTTLHSFFMCGSVANVQKIPCYLTIDRPKKNANS